jgi:hypothetical protein
MLVVVVEELVAVAVGVAVDATVPAQTFTLPC